MKRTILTPTICLTNIASTCVPIVEFTSGKTKLNFILDSGSEHGVLFSEIPGNIFVHKTNKCSDIRSIAGQTDLCPIVEVLLDYEGHECEAEMLVVKKGQEVDLNGIIETPVHGLLGTNFMKKYGFVIDFAKGEAFSTFLNDSTQ